MGNVSRYFLLPSKELWFLLTRRPDFQRRALFAFGYARYFELVGIW